jgi:hypothetical protein
MYTPNYLPPSYKKNNQHTRFDAGYPIDKNGRPYGCVNEGTCKSKRYLLIDTQQADFGFAAHC